MRVRDLDRFGPDGDLRYLLNTKLNYPEFIKSFHQNQPWHCKYGNTVLQVEEGTVYGESNSGQVACTVYRVFDGHRTFIVF